MADSGGYVSTMPPGTGAVQLLSQMRAGLPRGRRDALRYAAELTAVALAYFILAKSAWRSPRCIRAQARSGRRPVLRSPSYCCADTGCGQRFFLAAFVANVTTAGSITTGAMIAAGNSLELDRRRADQSVVRRARHVRDASQRGEVCADLPCSGDARERDGRGRHVMSCGLCGWANFAAIWITWWLGDLAGALVITPVIVLWASGAASSRDEQIESGLIFTAACLLGLIAFSPLIDQTPVRDPLGFLAIVPLLWAALRRGQRETGPSPSSCRASRSGERFFAAGRSRGQTSTIHFCCC